MKPYLQPLNTSNICMYEWNAWNGFMFSCICPHVSRIEAAIKQPNESIVRKIPSGTHYFLFHVNLTNTDHFYTDKLGLLAELKNKNITPLNHRISTISKSHLSKVCVSAGLNSARAERTGDPQELLIIKTNLNYGGLQEKKLTDEQRRKLDIESLTYIDTVQYPIVPRIQVPQEAWKNSDLVVEKFISNRHHHFYRVYKLLNRVVISEVVDTNPIKKMPEGIFRTNAYCETDTMSVQPISAAKHSALLKHVVAFSDQLGLDFGALDVVKSDEGEFYIVDVNTTPYWGKSGQQSMIDFLAGEESWSMHINS